MVRFTTKTDETAMVEVNFSAKLFGKFIHRNWLSFSCISRMDNVLNIQKANRYLTTI